MRWENSFLLLTDTTNMKDTEPIPWKSRQSHPSARAGFRRGTDAAAAALGLFADVLVPTPC